MKKIQGSTSLVNSKQKNLLDLTVNALTVHVPFFPCLLSISLLLCVLPGQSKLNLVSESISDNHMPL